MFNNRDCSIIGMIHLGPLPGAAGYGGSVKDILNKALEEASIYKECGFDALMIENMHDVPYLKGHVEPETTAAMAVVASALKEKIALPLGVQVLAGANLEALGVAVAADLDFIRVEGFVFAHVGDEGYQESCAAQLIRRRCNLKAERVQIFADIKKKHSAHAITADVSLAETAKAAEFFKADGVIVTGMHTADPPNPDDLARVKKNIHHCKVIVGSGATPENVNLYQLYCDAIIVGSSVKADGKWENDLDKKRAQEFIKACRS